MYKHICQPNEQKLAGRKWSSWTADGGAQQKRPILQPGIHVSSLKMHNIHASVISHLHLYLHLHLLNHIDITICTDSRTAVTGSTIAILGLLLIPVICHLRI